MGALDDLIYGFRAIYAAGVEQLVRRGINYGAGLLVTDNPAAGYQTVDVDIASLAAGVSTVGFSNMVRDAVRLLVTTLPAYTRTGNVITADSNGALPQIDGKDASPGDRVCLAIDAHPIDCWIYDVTSVGGTGSKFVFTRSSDSNTSAQVRQGMQVKVLEGDVYEGCVASIDLSVAPGAQIVLNTSPVVVVTGVNSPSLWTGGAALTIGNAVYSIILHAAHCEVEAPLKIPSYNVNSLPAVTGLTGCIIWVNNDKSGATFARCNGTYWLRTDTGAIIASS